jgi:hypothetical protein
MNSQLELHTIEEVEALAAKVGLNFTADEYSAAYALGEQRRAQVESQIEAGEGKRRGMGAWADRFNRALPRVLKAIMGIGNASTVIVYESIVGPGMLIALILLLVVEQQRVYHGVSLFEVYDALAWFAATVLVFSNIALEVQIARIEHRAAWKDPAKHQFSLKIWALRAAYIFGRVDNWQARPKSPALRFRSVLRLVTFSILALALAGSMQSVIAKTAGSWTEAIRVVLVESSLEEMVTWIGGLLFALAVVLVAQLFSHYAATTAIEIAAALENAAPDNRLQAALRAANMSAAAYLLARLKERQRERRALASAVDVPVASMIRAEVFPSVSGVPETRGNSRRAAQTGEGVSGVSDVPKTPRLTSAVLKALQWLEAEPSRTELSIRDAAEQAGVSSSTMQRAKAAYRAKQG